MTNTVTNLQQVLNQAHSYWKNSCDLNRYHECVPSGRGYENGVIDPGVRRAQGGGESTREYWTHMVSKARGLRRLSKETEAIHELRDLRCTRLPTPPHTDTPRNHVAKGERKHARRYHRKPHDTD